jgi:hypothetical protein
LAPKKMLDIRYESIQKATFMKPPSFQRLSLTCVLFLLGACTALETTQSPNADFDRKAHVGQYYLLPKALVSLAGAADADGNYLVTTSMNLVPDHRYKYFLNWKPNAFSEDIISSLEIGSDGLLSTVNYSAEDKTPVIIGDVITTGINLFKIAGDLGLTRAEHGGAPVKRPPFKYTFDPFSVNETTRVHDELLRNQRIALYISPEPAKIVHPPHADPESGGVFYHPPTTIELLLVDKSAAVRPQESPTPSSQAGQRADKKKPASASESPATAGASPAPSPATGGTQSPATAGASPVASPTTGGTKDSSNGAGSPATRCRVVFTVPDIDRIVCFRLGRSFMTKREANLTFSHGMPGKLVFKQPSAVQAVTGTLSSATSSVASAVPTLIKISDDRKIAALQEQTSLMTEQSKLLEARQKLIQDQQALAKATSPLPPNSSPRSDADISQLRSQIQQQQQNITNMRQDIKKKLQDSDLTSEEKKKAIEAAGLDQDEP